MIEVNTWLLFAIGLTGILARSEVAFAILLVYSIVRLIGG